MACEDCDTLRDKLMFLTTQCAEQRSRAEKLECLLELYKAIRVRVSGIPTAETMKDLMDLKERTKAAETKLAERTFERDVLRKSRAELEQLSLEGARDYSKLCGKIAALKAKLAERD